MMVARGETRTVNGRGSRSGMRKWVGEPGMVEQLWGEDDVGNQRGGSGRRGRWLRGGNGGRGDGIHSKSAKICGFYFSTSKNLRKKCVNRDNEFCKKSA